MSVSATRNTIVAVSDKERLSLYSKMQSSMGTG